MPHHHPPQPLDFYSNVDLKNWLVKTIKTRLSINNKAYSALYIIIELELIDLQLLGEKLNTRSNKAQVQRAFKNIQYKY